MEDLQKKYGLSSYSGKILKGDYSDVLKQRIADLVGTFLAFDATGVPGIPYITAWHHDDNIMWYEFAGREFIHLFGCSIETLANLFREAVVDHRLFHRTEVEAGVKETVRSRQELSGSRPGLRAEVTRKGNLEADYKVAFSGDAGYVWFKDQARVETFETDQVSLSIGFLTDVTNEMVHKDLLEQIGYFDQLTGLPNRIIMGRSLELKIAEYDRNQIDDFFFILLDIDHFKRVNDSFGHRAGDYVLATLGQVLNDVKRRSDEIGRFGGEEFYGIGLGDMFEGHEFAERIRRRIEVTPFVFEDRMIPVTVSIGVVTAGELKELDEDNLIEEADQRLYHAKRTGRNRVIWESVTR